MSVNKVFPLVKPFLANLHSTISKNTHICTPWPQSYYFFFNIWVSKKRRILRWFQIRGNNLKKVYLEKVICQKLVQVSGIEGDKLQFCTLLLPVTFLLANFFCIFLNRFQIIAKLWAVPTPMLKFCEEKVLRSY